MTIVCPECGTPYRLPSGLVPIQKSAAICKKCGTRMIIYPETQDDIDPSREKPSITEQENHQEPQDPVGETLESDSDLEENGVDTDNTDNDPQPDVPLDNRDEIIAVFPVLENLSADIFRISDIFSKDQRRGYNNKTNSSKVRILTVIAPLLATDILLDNEYVINIARGSAYYPWEIPYANGIFTLPTNYFAIVCTNYRLVLINIDSGATKPTRYIYQVFYEEIIRLSRGIFRTSIIIQTRNGRSWNFTTVGLSLSGEINDLILSRKKEGPSRNVGKTQGWQLCPECHEAISGFPTSCPSCSAEFKNPAVASKRAFMLPGLGSIYLGYIPLGILEMLLYVTSWIFLATLTYLSLPGIIPLGILMLITIHGTAAVMSLKLGQKGVIAEHVEGEEEIADKPDLDSDQQPPLT